MLYVVGSTTSKSDSVQVEFAKSVTGMLFVVAFVAMVAFAVGIDGFLLKGP